MTAELVFSGRQGGAGLSRKKLRGPGWQPIAYSVKASSDTDPDLWTYVRAHQARRATEAVACDWTAAALWRLPLPAAIGMDIDSIPLTIAAQSDESHDRSTAVQGRRRSMPAAHLTELDGVRLTTPARTWLDCCAFLSLGFSVAMADSALHRGMATRDELAQLIEWGRGRRGVRTARTALEFSDPRAESPRESWVRSSLLTFGIPRPEVNVDIYNEDGGWIARVDMAWPEYRVILEYDGREFHGPAHAEHDHARRRRLADAGWTVIVLRAEDLSDMAACAVRVLGAFRRAQASAS